MFRSEMEVVNYDKKIAMQCKIVFIESSAPHWHYCYEILFILKGSINLKVGKSDYPMRDGDFILVNSREVHSVRSFQPQSLCLVLQFDTNIIEEEYGADRIFIFDLNTVTNERVCETAIREFRQTLAQMGIAKVIEPDGYKFLIKSFLYRFIADLFKYTKYDFEPRNDPSAEGGDLEIYEKVNQYIKSNFNRDIGIEELCKNVGISKSTLYRVLRKTAASTYKDLIDFYRVEYSKYLLKNTRNHISNIASASGFNSDVSFYRVFRKYVGILPNYYRNDNFPSSKTTSIQGYTATEDNEVKASLEQYL